MRSQGENPANRGTGRSVPGRAAEQQTVMGRKYGGGSIFGAGRVILEIGKHQGRQPKREKALLLYVSADTGHSWRMAALPRHVTEQNGQKNRAAPQGRSARAGRCAGPQAPSRPKCGTLRGGPGPQHRRRPAAEYARRSDPAKGRTKKGGSGWHPSESLISSGRI